MGGKGAFPVLPPPTHPDMWKTRKKEQEKKEKPKDDGDFRSKTPSDFR